jgi:hypothetical protein
LNQEVIKSNNLDPAEVEGAVAGALTRFDGVALAISSSALSTGDVPDMPMVRSILRNYSPSRSGDVYVVFEPHRFINDLEGTVVTASHGSPWRYDQHVPVIFAGWGIPAQRVHRPVETVDVAPTLSALFGAKPPSGSVGAPLLEVLDRPGG